MSYLNTILIILLFSSFSYQKKQSEVYYINMATSPIASIDCSVLKSHQNKKKIILSYIEKAKLIRLFSRLKPVQKKTSIDSRIYGVIYQGTQEIHFCSGIGIIEINNKNYIVDDELRDYFITMTYSRNK